MEFGVPGEGAAGVFVLTLHIEPALVCSENTFQHEVLFVLCRGGLLPRPKGLLSNIRGSLFLRLALGLSRRIRLLSGLRGAFRTRLNSRLIAQMPAISFWYLAFLTSSVSTLL